MDEGECLRRYGLRPFGADLEEIRELLGVRTALERRAQGDGDTELMKLCCVRSFGRKVGLMHSTQVSGHVNAPRPAVYRALLDADAIAKWRVPAGMSAHVHEFDAREGGSFRVSLTYDAPSRTGKSTARTDTYHGHFAKLVPDEQVVEVLEFETADPALRGTMTMTTRLTDADGGTDVLIMHDGIPDGVPAADNETGTRMALANLAALVEAAL